MMPDTMPSAEVAPGVAVPLTASPSEATATAVSAVCAVATPMPAASTDARRIAGAILEVLAGVRSITDAALALGVPPARYYVLEARAVVGLIAACEPRSPGPQGGSGLVGEIDRLRVERDRLRDEAARYQTLVRIAQTAFAPMGGVPVATQATPPAQTPGLTVRQRRAQRAAERAAAPPPVPAVAARARKKRVPTVRALRLAQQVQQAPPSAVLPTGVPAAIPGPAPGG